MRSLDRSPFRKPPRTHADVDVEKEPRRNKRLEAMEAFADRILAGRRAGRVRHADGIVGTQKPPRTWMSSDGGDTWVRVE